MLVEGAKPREFKRAIAMPLDITAYRIDESNLGGHPWLPEIE
jgi:hypothetical protein